MWYIGQVDIGKTETFLVNAKTENKAESAAEKYYSSEKLYIVDGFDSFTDAENVAKSIYKGKVSAYIDEKGNSISKNQLKKFMNESVKINYPSLKKMMNIEYGDPRQKDGCTIVAEKCGKLKKKNEVIEGSYIMYEDSEMKGKYIAVHVSESINEESGEPEVNMIAIGDKKSVRNKMGYQIRKHKNLEESREVILNRKINEVKINKQKVQNATEYVDNYDFKKSIQFITMLQGYGISTEPGYEYTIDDAVDSFDEKDKQMFIKDMKKFGFKVT